MTRKYKKLKSIHIPIPPKNIVSSKSCKHITNISTETQYETYCPPKSPNNDKLLFSLELCRLLDIAKQFYKYIMTINSVLFH